MTRGYLTSCFLLISVMANSQTLPDFSHPEHPHVMSKNPFAFPSQLDQFDNLEPKTGQQPLMVILLEFPDSHHIHTPKFFENRLFGHDPSVNGYYKEVSYGKYSFTNAGILGWFVAPHPESYYFKNGHYTELAADAVQAAISGEVQFENYDSNGDGEITRDELIIQMVFAAHSPLDLPWVWSTRPDQTKSTGVITPNGLEIDTWAVRGEEYGNISLFSHELAHAALALPDLYTDDFGGDPSGLFTLMANISRDYVTHFSPWAKIHLGWIDPIVVTQSGQYSISASEQNPVAYILYDPNHGVNEYFIIENRWPAASLYENGLPESGLAIWHITEFYDDEPFNFLKGRKMVAMKWAGGDNSLDVMPPTALWDCAESASCYDFTEGSQPRNSQWQDSTSSGIEITNISNAGLTMDAYFSIPAVVNVSDNPHQRPTDFALFQNYPNPFNPETRINYQIPSAFVVTLKIFNVSGQLVATLVNEYQNAGFHSLVWNGKDQRKSEVTSGMYFYRLQADGHIQVRKMLKIQ